MALLCIVRYLQSPAHRAQNSKKISTTVQCVPAIGRPTLSLSLTKLDASAIAKALSVGKPADSDARVGLGLGPRNDAGVDRAYQRNTAVQDERLDRLLVLACVRAAQGTKEKKKEREE